MIHQNAIIALFATVFAMKGADGAGSIRATATAASPRFLQEVMCPPTIPKNAGQCPSNVNESCGYDASGKLDPSGGTSSTTLCTCEKLLGTSEKNTYEWSCHDQGGSAVCPSYRPTTGSTCATKDVGDHCLYDDANTRCSCVHLLGSDSSSPQWDCAEVCPANPETSHGVGRECTHEEQVCDYACGDCECVRVSPEQSTYHWVCKLDKCHV